MEKSNMRGQTIMLLSTAIIMTTTKGIGERGGIMQGLALISTMLELEYKLRLTERLKL
jgi:hypothetical protein